MKPNVSIAIETSCRRGGVALGLGEELVRTIAFDASSRHATHLISRLEELLKGAGRKPRDLAEAYVCVGPGSFTGVRVGVTVARTLGQAIPDLRLVAVPTAPAVAENVRHLDWDHLGVILDAKEELVYACLLRRPDPPRTGAPPDTRQIAPAAAPAVVTLREFLTASPRPLLLVGEALAYQDAADLRADGVSIAGPVDSELHLPTAEGVWRVGRRMAAAGEFTDFRSLLPIYARKPEAVRLWERRHGQAP